MKNKKLLITLAILMFALGFIVYDMAKSDNTGLDITIYNDTKEDISNIMVNYNLSDGPVVIDEIGKRDKKLVNIKPKGNFKKTVLKMNIPNYNQGKDIVILDEVEKNTTGKISVYIKMDKNGQIEVNVRKLFLKNV